MLDPTNRRVDDLAAGIRALLSSVDRLQETVAANTVMLDRNTQDIEKHIKRTDLLESLVADLVIPIKTLKFILIVAGGFSTAAASLFAAHQLFALAGKLF